MSVRGRGCLELRQSDNPFFQPVSHDIGLTAKEAVEWKTNGAPPTFGGKPYKVDGNFSFLYSRESDRIGSRVTKPPMSETRLLTRSEFLKQRREKAFETGNYSTEGLENTQKSIDAQEFLKTWKHEPKYEDPRYLTSNADYGKKPPSVATIVTDRSVCPQGFSNSFGGVKPKNTSLTTSLTKSNVHKNLDPQFA